VNVFVDRIMERSMLDRDTGVVSMPSWSGSSHLYVRLLPVQIELKCLLVLYVIVLNFIHSSSNTLRGDLFEDTESAQE